MSRYWVTSLPLRVGKSFELFVQGHRVAHIMHYQHGSIQTLVLFDRQFGFERLRVRPGNSEAGLNRQQQASLRAVLRPCKLVFRAKWIDVHAKEFGGSTPLRGSVETVLLRIGEGLKLHHEFDLPYLIDPNKRLTSGEAKLKTRDAPVTPVSKYLWGVDRARRLTRRPRIRAPVN